MGENRACRICRERKATRVWDNDYVCATCSDRAPFQDYRYLLSPNGNHRLNARTYVRDHDRLENGHTYAVEDLVRDFGMARLSKNGPEPHELTFIVEQIG